MSSNRHSGTGGETLPEPPRPRGNYSPVTVHKSVAYTSGMTPRRDGELQVVGRVGDVVSVSQAVEAAEMAASNALAAVVDAVGGLERIDRVLAMTVWVMAISTFTEHSRIADGASSLVQRVLATGPPSARVAVGVASLPGGSPVEVAMVVALLDEKLPDR